MPTRSATLPTRYPNAAFQTAIPSYFLSIAAAAAATLIALDMLVRMRGVVDARSASAAIGLVVMLASCHGVYGYLKPDPRIAAITGGLAVVIWSAMMAGVTSLIGLRAQAPTIDHRLAEVDAWMKVSTPAIVEWLAGSPLAIDVLTLAYLSSFPLLFATIIVLGGTGRLARCWELCFAFSGSITVCAVVSAAYPAVGAFVHYGVSSGLADALPAGAGVYHLAAFHAYREGAATIDFAHLQGVVTFPSFHTALALMTAWAWRDVKWAAWPCAGWNMVVLISTIPVGGHYAIDLLGGAVVWCAFTLLACLDRTRAAVRTDRLPVSGV